MTAQIEGQEGYLIISTVCIVLCFWSYEPDDQPVDPSATWAMVRLSIDFLPRRRVVRWRRACCKQLRGGSEEDPSSLSGWQVTCPRLCWADPAKLQADRLPVAAGFWLVLPCPRYLLSADVPDVADWPDV